MNPSTVRSACLRIERNVPRANSTVHRDDHRSSLLIAQLQVAAALAHLGESNLGQRTYYAAAGHHGEARAHAGMSTGAMIGVST
jgi:hypothetical protein